MKYIISERQYKLLMEEISVVQDEFSNVKPGVEELFDTVPQLSEIGTPEQYSKYLDTIFPESENKEIWYHATNIDPSIITRFKSSPSGTFGPGVYFQSEKGYWTTEKVGKNTIWAIVNANKLFDFSKFGDDMIKKYRDEYNSIRKTSETPRPTFALQKELIGMGYNSLFDIQTKTNKYLLVFPGFEDQIHILGNEQDIQGFKNYLNQIELMKSK